MTCSSISQYLSSAPPHDIVQWIEALETEELRMAAMHVLLAENPAKANHVLCDFYDVACYNVGESCFADEAPANEKDKWFISVITGTFCGVDMAAVPLADSLADAHATAVKALKLKDLFFDEFV